MKALFIKNRNISIGLILTFLLLVPQISSAQDGGVYRNQLKFGRLLRLVDSYYVDTVNVDKLTEDAIKELLSELDPHSVYISKEDVEKMNEPLEGNFEGIGISFNIYKDTLLVTSIIAGGPSEKVGLMAGDRIIEVDNKNIAGIGINNDDVFNLLRGKKGTEVELKVVRRNVHDLLDFTIIRDKIPIYSLDASYMLDKSTGYIKLNKFAATTTDEFTNAINELKKQNIKNLVLDLRENGGGYLKTAIEIADQFLSDGKMVVFTSGVNDPRQEYRATSDGTFENGNLVVLVDEGTASASEIVSGAVQDWDRGIIVGRRTFGKGLVQKPYFLTDGSMVRLTTAHYYTPSGRCIQKPYNKGITAYQEDIQNRLSNGELFSADSISITDSVKYKTLVNGRTVFGGGGIIPDIFVPIDTSVNYRYFNRLRKNNIINNFVLGFLDNNREKLIKEYANFENYNSNFQVTQEMIDKIVEKGESEGIEKDEEGLLFIMNNIKKEVKALIARNIFSLNDFYKIYNQDDECILKALQVIENQNEYNNLLVSKD